jgi:predicted TIM-barrel fold metal-dependent hydrolase
MAGWDCHAHVFGPYEQYPLARERSYTPPEASVEEYLALLHSLGLEAGVLVHPSAYGESYARVLDALKLYPQLRGVLVSQTGASLKLKELRAQGIRGFRFSHRSGTAANFAGSATWENLKAMAPRLAGAGLHAELWTDCDILPMISEDLAALPIPVVIDHMGGFNVGAGINAPGFQSLLRLVSCGQVWVKLCAYRNLFKPFDLEQGEPFHRALLECNPERLIWGSDWPHLRVVPEPNTADLLQLFKRWTVSEALAERILIDNPRALYE